MTQPNRFTDRVMTIQEAIWLDQGQKEDVESLVLWLESRLNDENRNLDIRSMPETMLPVLVSEALQGCKRATEVTLFLESLEGQLKEET